MQIASPCTEMCKLDATGLVCLGCRRTIGEIIAWAEMTDDEKRQVLRRLAALPPHQDAA